MESFWSSNSPESIIFKYKVKLFHIEFTGTDSKYLESESELFFYSRFGYGKQTNNRLSQEIHNKYCINIILTKYLRCNFEKITVKKKKKIKIEKKR